MSLDMRMCTFIVHGCSGEAKALIRKFDGQKNWPFDSQGWNTTEGAAYQVDLPAASFDVEHDGNRVVLTDEGRVLLALLEEGGTL